MAGQIIARGVDTWVVRVFLGRDAATGKRRYHNKTIHGKKRTAQKYLNGVLRDLDLGTFTEPSKRTVREYLDQWLSSAAKPKLREKTFASYEWLIEHYVKPALGSNRLDQLTPLEVQKLYTSLQEGGLSARTVRYTHSVLSSALNQAVKWGMVHRNVCDQVDLPRQSKKEMQALSPAEAARFLATAKDDRWYCLFAFALATGCRPGEYLGLQWKDVDLRVGAATIQRTLSRAKGGWSFAEPKTSQSRRTLPLPVSVTRALQDHWRRQAEDRMALGPQYTNLDLVFATELGTPLDVHNLTIRHFKPILRAAGLSESIRLYDLRHSMATLLLSAGEHPKIASERLGHASITLTMDTYSHVQPHMQRQAAERLENILFGLDEDEKGVSAR
jgi:integrase